MKTHLSGTSKLGLLFATAFLALQAAPAAAAEAAGSGTVAIGKERPVTFTDAYAFRAEDFSDNTKHVTLVILSESPMDKKAMTAALKKERQKDAVDKYLMSKAFIRLKVEPDGKIEDYYLFVPPGSNLNASSNKTKSDVKTNTAKRVEGSFSHHDTNSRGEWRKIDLRFATDVADVGPPVKN
jgi:hypothetical protein